MERSTKNVLAGILVGCVGWLFGTAMLFEGKIGELSFIAILTLSVVIATLFAFSDRLKEFNLSKMRVVLAEVRETQKDIQSREERTAKIALISAEITAFSAALSNRAMDEEALAFQQKWLRMKTDQLLALAGSDESERQRVLHYLETVIRMDALTSGSPEKSALWNGIWENVKADLNAGPPLVQ